MSIIAVVSAILILVAELGDKSQLLILLLATRYKAWQVLLGISVAALLLSTLAVMAGTLLGDLIPKTAISIVAGLLFIGFGVFTLLAGGSDEDEAAENAAEEKSLDARSSLLRFGPVAVSFGAFFLAELGDKTQVLTLTIAADPQSAFISATRLFGEKASTWAAAMGVGAGDISYLSTAIAVVIGATVGMLIADLLALIFGSILGKSLPQGVIAKVSGILFIFFGILTLLPILSAKFGG